MVLLATSPRPALLPFVATTAMGLLLACSAPSVHDDCGVTVCEVFFTEVLANPSGVASGEYVEIYNPADEPVDLSGCVFVVQKGVSSEKRHTIPAGTSVVVPPRGYAVIGPPTSTVAAYRWGDSVGDLPNSGDAPVTLLLRSQTEDIARFTYLAAEEAPGPGVPVAKRSFQLDPGARSCLASEAPTSWCTTAEGLEPGTPGADNVCPISAVCSLESACQVLITEVLAWNATGERSEFVEILNPGTTDLDLRGCTFTLQKGTGAVKQVTVTGDAPVTVSAGGRLIMGPPDEAEVEWSWGGTIDSLPNTSTTGPVTLRVLSGTTEITSFTYLTAEESGGLGAPTQGSSFQLDPAKETCEGAADIANWYVVPDGSESGVPVHTAGAVNQPPIRPPACPLETACQVLITEVLAARGGATGHGEFVELLNPGATALDLRGCVFEYTRGTSKAESRMVSGESPVTIAAGGRLLLGPPSATEVDWSWGEGIGDLANSSSTGAVTLRILSGTTEIASFTYLTAEESGGLGAPTTGSSFQLDPAKETCDGAADATSWCVVEEGARSGRPVNTAGAPNDCPPPIPDCPLTAVCEILVTEVMATGTAEFVELANPGTADVDLRGCVLEYTKGTTTKRSRILGDAPVAIGGGGRLVIGPAANPIVDWAWDAIPALPNTSTTGPATLRLLSGETTIASFTYLDATETTGLGTPGEDVSFQLADETCAGSASLSAWCEATPTPGAPDACPPSCALSACQVLFSELLPNPDGSGSAKEYLEILNPGRVDAVLDGCVLAFVKGTSDADTEVLFAATPLVVPAGGYVLLGPKDAAGVAYNWSSGLGNLTDSPQAPVTLRLLAGATVVTEVTYGVTEGMAGLGQPVSGEAFQRSASDTECSPADARWCLATLPSDADDRGSPGAANEECAGLPLRAPRR